MESGKFRLEKIKPRHEKDFPAFKRLRRELSKVIGTSQPGDTVLAGMCAYSNWIGIASFTAGEGIHGAFQAMTVEHNTVCEANHHFVLSIVNLNEHRVNAHMDTAYKTVENVKYQMRVALNKSLSS